MNRQITRLAVTAVVLLSALVVGTTYWQAWAVGGLEARQDNAIQRVAQFTIKRGLFFASDGKTLLAANRERAIEGRTYFFRRYPRADLVSGVVGYSTQTRSRAGLERSLNDYLTASNEHLRTVLDRTLDRISGGTITGNNVTLTIDAEAQAIAEEALGSNCGAAVALEPKTGRVLVMTTSPRYDPNLVETRFSAIERSAADARCKPAAPLLNRATNGLYIPGSTFKVVTAAAALDTGAFDIDSRFDDPGYCIEYGKRVYNYADQSGPARYGRVSFLQALQYSINAVFCEVGKKIGPLTLIEYAKRFGFYEDPPLETPAGERSPSGLYDGGSLFSPRDPNAVDPGRFAFGQERLLVTPLQMAMVASAIANGGTLMRPYVVERIGSPDGSTINRTRPRVLSRAVKPETAAKLAEMMEAAVRSGTGTAAQLPGVRVAGKTGTAETGVDDRNETSFIAFAPVDDPQIAVAVMLEEQSGTGGGTAAPVARAIMQALMEGA